MTSLVLDTAMPLATVAVVEGARVLGAHVLSEPKRHAESLADALDRALFAAGRTVDQIEAIGVGRGPGSFIGVRTGIAFAKGLGVGRGVPVVGLPTLVALAWSVDLATLPQGQGVVAIDAKRGEVFVQAVTHRAGEIVVDGEPAAWALEAARERASASAFVIGNASAVLAGFPASDQAVHLEGPLAVGLARVLAQRGAAADELDALVPDYCRDADAKLPAQDPGARRNQFGS